MTRQPPHAIDTESRCHWAGSDRPRMLRQHQASCETNTCQGCVPCAERHCGVCGRAHVTIGGRGTDQTCADCLGAARGDLAEITAMAGPRMLREATLRGVDSEATMLAGPAAEPGIWQRRHRLVTNAALAAPDDRHPAYRAWKAWLDDCRDERHPLWVLGTWDRLVREHLGHDEPDDQLTIAGAAAYLEQHLTRLAHDEGFAFEELARDLRDCRGHLEDVLHDGVREERGAPCPGCGRADLVKVWGDDETADRWTCPKCRQWWTEHDYRVRVAAVYVGVAPALTASQIHQAYRVNESTVRTWAQRGKVGRRGKDEQGRMLYDVADVLATRDSAAASA